MAHIEIFFKIAALLAGVWALSEVRQAMRAYSSPFLAPVLLFLAFQNIVVLVGLVSSYCCANILGTCLFYPTLIIARFLGPFAFFGVTGRTAALVLIVFGFLDSRPSRRLWIWLSAGLAGLTLFVSVPELGIGGKAVQTAVGNFKVFLYAGAVVASLAAMAVLVLVGHGRRDPKKRALVLSWAYPLLFAHLGLLATHWMRPIPSVAAIGTLLLFINILPSWWVRRRYLPQCREAALQSENGNALDELFRRFNVSPREQEVARLILVGKSHKEIQKELFISLNTVKNHIAHLYQKMGIGSRWQLLQIVQELKKGGF